MKQILFFLRAKKQQGLALAGIILVVLNLRPAITSLSPIYDQIGKNIPLSAATLGILGMLPPLGFAVFGILTPRLIFKLGLERSLVFAMALVFAGQALRSFTNDIWPFGITSVVCLAGMGIGNVLIPPIIKSYFPERIGLLTGIYTSVIAVGAAIPSLIAVPVTQALGWRVSTGMWAVLALLGAIPWLFLQNKKFKPVQVYHHNMFTAWRWPIAWAITIIFAIGALNNYTMIAWLPKILTSSAGVNQAISGMMLSMYNLIGIPLCLLVPTMLSRYRRPFLFIVFGVTCLFIGYSGLAYLPVFAWMWILPAGVGLMLIPISLTLINLRSRTEEGSTVLSGFTQGTGYFIGAVGPLAVGGLHSITGNWMAAFWFLLILAIAALMVGVIAVKPKYIEDSCK